MTFDEEEYAFFHELGAALAVWAQVESTMCFIVCLCAGGGSNSLSGAVGHSFTCIENLRTRRQFLDALVLRTQYNKPELLKRWPPLSDRIGSASALRNKLAHQQTLIAPTGKPGKRIGLVPFGWPVSKKQVLATTKKIDAITIQHVAHYGMTFSRLHVDLANFQWALAGRKEPFPESSGQPQRLPTVRQIEARMRAALGRQPRPSGALPSQQ